MERITLVESVLILALVAASQVLPSAPPDAEWPVAPTALSTGVGAAGSAAPSTADLGPGRSRGPLVDSVSGRIE